MRENGYSKVIPAKNMIITQMLFFKFGTTQLRNGPTFAEIEYFGKKKGGHFQMKIAKMSSFVNGSNCCTKSLRNVHLS